MIIEAQLEVFCKRFDPRYQYEICCHWLIPHVQLWPAFFQLKYYHILLSKTVKNASNQSVLFTNQSVLFTVNTAAYYQHHSVLITAVMIFPFTKCFKSVNNPQNPTLNTNTCGRLRKKSNNILLRTVQRKTFEGENFCGLVKSTIFVEKTFADCSRAKGRHAPKFCGENFREQPQNCEIRESLLPRTFPTIRYFKRFTIFEVLQHTTSIKGWAYTCKLHRRVRHSSIYAARKCMSPTLNGSSELQHSNIDEIHNGTMFDFYQDCHTWLLCKISPHCQYGILLPLWLNTTVPSQHS